MKNHKLSIIVLVLLTAFFYSIGMSEPSDTSVAMGLFVSVVMAAPAVIAVFIFELIINIIRKYFALKNHSEAYAHAYPENCNQNTVLLNRFSSKVLYDDTDEFSLEAFEEANIKAYEHFCDTFDLSSVEAIMSIPNQKFEAADRYYNSCTSCANILGRKATEFKKAGRMDLAIACLRKCNEWTGQITSNRLIDYLKLNRQFDEARNEEAKLIELIEYKDNDFSGLNEIVARAREYGNCWIIFNTSRTCPQCSPYNNRLYSAAYNDSYPHINLAPEFLKNSKCPTCGKYIGKNIMFDFALSGHPDIIALNSTPVTDTRTQEQIEYFELEQLSQQRAQMTKFEYDWLWENMPEICPKSLSGYSRMKNSNSANFQKIVSAAKEKGFDIISL